MIVMWHPTVVFKIDFLLSNFILKFSPKESKSFSVYLKLVRADVYDFSSMIFLDASDNRFRRRSGVLSILF